MKRSRKRAAKLVKRVRDFMQNMKESYSGQYHKPGSNKK